MLWALWYQNFSIPELSGFPAVNTLLKQAQEKRNVIIHGRWDFVAKTGEVFISRITARGKFKTSLRVIPLTEVTEAADLVYKAADELYALILKAGATNNPPQEGQ
jgi:hypothetical protein